MGGGGGDGSGLWDLGDQVWAINLPLLWLSKQEFSCVFIAMFYCVHAGFDAQIKLFYSVKL